MHPTNTTATIFENISKAGAVSPTTLNGLPGMSSLEIAEITGKPMTMYSETSERCSTSWKRKPQIWGHLNGSRPATSQVK